MITWNLLNMTLIRQPFINSKMKTFYQLKIDHWKPFTRPNSKLTESIMVEALKSGKKLCSKKFINISWESIP